MQTVIDFALVQNTVEHLPLAVAILDSTLCFVACSRRFTEECDIHIDPIGRHFHEVFPGTGNRWIQLGQRGLAGESLTARHDPFVWPGGTVSWLDWEMVPWMPDGVAIAGIVVTLKIVNEDAEVTAVRSQIEEQLRREHVRYQLMEQQHRTILDLSNEIMIVCSFSGRLFDCNAATQRILGVNLLDANPESLLDYIHPLDRQLLVESVRSSIEEGSTATEVSIRCRRSDGAYRWLDWNFSLLFEYQLILGVARDVTDEQERQAEQACTIDALRRSQDRLMQAERIAAIGYWASNLDGSDPHFSEGVYNIYGLSPEHPLTSVQELWQFTHDNRYEGCVDALRRAIESGEPFEVEYVIRRPDGSLRTIQGRGARRDDPAAQVPQIQGIIQDITTQVQAAQALREREQQLAEAQHIAHIGSWRWDIATDEVSWSQELYVILGYHTAEVRPSFVRFMDRVLPEDRALVAAKIETAVSSKQPDQYRHRIQVPNGEIRTLHVRHRPHVDENGVVVVLEGTSQDVTEMIAVERMLAQQAKDLAQSNQDLTQFAYVASHDLREPLRKVKSFTELLALRYGDQLGEEGSEWIRYIVNDTARMQRLIQNVLDYSQINHDRQLKQVTNLNRIFEQTCTSLHTLIQSTSAQVTATELPTVFANPTQISQLLQNLVENALKFHAIEPPQVSVTARRAGDFWRVEVADNGIGIEARQHQRIFEMFSRLHRRDQYEGNGLGLAVCMKIVEGHGGQIGVESEPGRGSLFWFTLPVAEVTGDSHQSA